MKRDEYLADKDVAGFVRWAGHLVRGDWGLEHSYKGKGPAFRCSTLYRAYEGYRWPNSVNGESANATMGRFDDYRRRFAAVQPVTTDADRREFFAIAAEILKWGGINNLKPGSNQHWGRMSPAQLQQHIEEIKSALNPETANTWNLQGVLSVTSGFSKIYSALVPGFPIYDSRVACALTCLIRLYERKAGSNASGDKLSFPVPAHRGSRRCTHPAIRYGQDRKYAEANLKCAWLLAKLIEQPGDFAQVCESRRVDALQSALFMLGYAKLQDDAVVKRV